MLSYLKKYMKESILAPLFKMLEALLDLIVPLITAEIINVGIGEHNTPFILKTCGILVLLALIGLGCSVTAQYFAAKASAGYTADLRRDVFHHIEQLGYSEMDTLGTSTLITRMTSDLNQVQSGLNLFLRLFLRSPFVVFGCLIMAFRIDRSAAMIFVAVIPALAIVVFGILLLTLPMYKGVQGKLDRILGRTRDSLSGVRVVRAFNREQNEVARFETEDKALAKLQLKVGKISALMNPVTFCIINLGIIAVLYRGAFRIDAGALQQGDVIALVSYMSQILVELVKLANLIIQMSKAAACSGRVKTVLQTRSAMEFPAPGQTPPADAGDAVRFDGVSLTYAGSAASSLQDISFAAKRGQVVGIIGGTGSGKSSLVNLIPRFYDSSAGEVRVLGAPVRDYAKNALRDRIGVVPQKALLFEGTIRSNLLWGKEGASDDELWEALRIAQADDFVRGKEGGLDAPVEQGGRNFSGGQKQRLTIARALVRKPEILILDDSTSALDFATDAALRKALRSLPKTITIFMVSQRTSSIQYADQILVLDDGSLSGAGTHEELLERCGVYREIYDSQFRKGGEAV